MNCNAVEKHIINWLTDQIKQTKLDCFVVGISGGVDSALVSTLCAKTNFKTILISLPIFQEASQLTRARSHMSWLTTTFSNTKECEVVLDYTFEAISKGFSKEVSDDPLAMANTRSRLRMTTLYAYANHYKGLVVGTGNKIEDFGVFFFTKGGDGMVDISPTGDLSKSQVWELAKHIGVNNDIVQAKPTDGLWEDNRGDEDAIGASYPELEWAMAYCESNSYTKEYLEQKSNQCLSCLAYVGLSKREEQVLEIYLKRNIQGQHKIKPIPICKIPQIIL